MSRKTKIDNAKKAETPAPARTEELPALVKQVPELLPLYDWWKKEGTSTLTCILVAVAAVCAVKIYKSHAQSRDAKGGATLVELSQPNGVDTPDAIRETAEFADALADNSSSKAATALALRLAKKYYDESDFENALAEYEAIEKRVEKNDPFYGFAQAGVAFSLEGLKRYSEASEKFAAIAGDASAFTFVAKIGAARTQGLAGDKDGAVAALEALKAGASDFEKSRIESEIDLVKRFDPEAKSLLAAVDNTDLFAAADVAAAAIEGEKSDAPELPAVEEAPAAAEEAPATEAAPAAEEKVE